MLTLQTYKPVYLPHIIKSCWHLKIENELVEDIFPDGHHEIIFNTNGAKRTANNDWINEPTSFIAGQTSRSYSLVLKPGSELYGIRFYPHTCLFDFPAHYSTDTIIQLSDIAGGKQLQNCITKDPLQTFHNFETTLIKYLKTPPEKFRYINYAVNNILQTHGDLRIDQLLTDTGISSKYLDTLFKDYVGLGPKSFSNIIRLNYFINYRNSHPRKNLTECVYEAGFFDQSHLINNFRTITGKSPKAYFQNNNSINDQFINL